MSDALDDILSQIPIRALKKPKKLLSHLEVAYTVGVPPLMVVPMTDLLREASGHTFHIGTPDPEMRRIASWIFTTLGNERILMQQIIEALWSRRGREDLKLVGLLLANIGTRPWEVFFDLISERSHMSLEVVLEIGEEIARAGYPVPGDDVLEKWAKGGKVAHQCSVLLLSLRREGGLPHNLISSAPEGGELFERIRSRLLTA